MGPGPSGNEIDLKPPKGTVKTGEFGPAALVRQEWKTRDMALGLEGAKQSGAAKGNNTHLLVLAGTGKRRKTMHRRSLPLSEKKSVAREGVGRRGEKLLTRSKSVKDLN